MLRTYVGCVSFLSGNAMRFYIGGGALRRKLVFFIAELIKSFRTRCLGSPERGGEGVVVGKEKPVKSNLISFFFVGSKDYKLCGRVQKKWFSREMDIENL